MILFEAVQENNNGHVRIDLEYNSMRVKMHHCQDTEFDVPISVEDLKAMIRKIRALRNMAELMADPDVHGGGPDYPY